MKGGRLIEATAEGVTIRDSAGNKCCFEWSEVTRVEAYKIDLLTTDDVCLEFVIHDRSCVACEDDSCWPQLISQLLPRFLISESWFERVVQPPFGSNRALLWDRRVHQAQARWQTRDVEALWRLSRADLAPDGALRDISINNVSEAEWNEMIAVARGTCTHLTVTSAGHQLPHDLAKKHFVGDSRATLSFRVGPVDFSGHCFDSARIELSFAPHQIRSSGDLAELLGFVVTVAAFLQRPAFITHENLAEAPIFRIDPNGHVNFLAPGAG